MKNSAKTIFIILLSFVFTTQAQNSTNKKSNVRSLEETVSTLDSRWDTNNSFSIPSHAYQSVFANPGVKSEAYSWSIFSFKHNESETISDKTISNDLKTFSSLLENAYQAYSRENAAKSIKSIGNFTKFIGIRVSDLALNSRNIKPSKKVEKMSASENEQTLSIIDLSRKFADSPWASRQKLLAYKYLTCSTISMPWIWNYLDAEFTRVAHKGGAITDNLIFQRLTISEVATMKNNSRVWRKAPRFFTNQLEFVEKPLPKNDTWPKFEFTPKETRVTYAISVALRESWLYFDKKSYLVDYDTKEQYKLKRIENNIPVGKTFVAVGCEGKILKITLIYPPVNPTMKSFTLENHAVVPAEQSKKLRYLKKTNQMTDGSRAYVSKVYQRNP